MFFQLSWINPIKIDVSIIVIGASWTKHYHAECWGFLNNASSTTPRSMGSTMRSKTNPLGRNDSEAVSNGNVLASRAIILMLLASAKGVFWCLEQPSSSCMEYHPIFQALLRLLTVRRVTFRMSQFGSPTPKRTILYSSSSETQMIRDSGVLQRLFTSVRLCYGNSKGEMDPQQNNLFWWYLFWYVSFLMIPLLICLDV